MTASPNQPDELPAGLRYSERMLWTGAPEPTRVLLRRIAALRSGLRVAEEAQARVAELEAALQEALLGLTRAREREAEQDLTDESMGLTLALNRHINTVQAALKGKESDG